MTVAYKDGFKIADTRKSQLESPLEQYCVLVFFASGQSRVQYTLFFIRTFFIRTSRLELAKILRTCQEHTQAEILLRTSLSCLHICRISYVHGNKIKCNNLVRVSYRLFEPQMLEFL